MDRTFSLADAAQALAHVGEGHARGKTVISVGAPESAARPPAAAVARLETPVAAAV
jgi:hypothetical protein